MQRELDEIRDTMFLSNREHKEESSRLEQQFLEERISLQKEADQKISELADRAHQEAMAYVKWIIVLLNLINAKK